MSCISPRRHLRRFRLGQNCREKLPEKLRKSRTKNLSYLECPVVAVRGCLLRDWKPQNLKERNAHETDNGFPFSSSSKNLVIFSHFGIKDYKSDEPSYSCDRSLELQVKRKKAKKKKRLSLGSSPGQGMNRDTLQEW